MNSLQPPFSDIVGESSPVQKAIKMIWEIFANHPLPNNKSIASQSAAEQIVLHLLGTMNSIGMINAAGYHSAAVTLMRSIEDALDCLFAVVQSDINANKWLNGELKASQAARTWTADKVVDQSIPLGDYRKNIRHGLNKYSHCSPNQTSWNIYRKSDEKGMCRLELNYQHAVISKNGYYIDRYLCIHLYELKVIELPAQRFQQFSRALLADYSYTRNPSSGILLPPILQVETPEHPHSGTDAYKPPDDPQSQDALES